MNKRFLPLLAVITLGACAPDAPERSGPVVRDSAGVRIVENTRPMWQDGEEWRLSPEPVVHVGGGDKEEEQLFRVSGAWKLGDGRILVVNGGTAELRFYDETGRLLTSAGARGSGPGEFRALMWAGPYRGDSVAAFDGHLQQRRVSIFDSTGRLARMFAVVADSGRPPEIVGVFLDGSFLARNGLFGGGFGGTGRPTEVLRPDERLYRFGPSGALGTISAPIAGSELFVLRRPGGLTVIPHPLGRTTTVRVHGDRYYVSIGDAVEVRAYRADGTLTTIVRRLRDPAPTSRRDVSAVRNRMLTEASSDENRRFVRQVFRELPTPSTLPAITDVMVDDDDNIWVTEYAPPGGHTRIWHVYGDDGILLGPVAIASDLTPLHIGADFLIALNRDDLDVEYVRLYDLIKPGQ